MPSFKIVTLSMALLAFAGTGYVSKASATEMTTVSAAEVTPRLTVEKKFAHDLFDMLQRMSDADQKRNYRGTFILRKSDDITTLQVTHGKDEKGEWESLEALNGEARTVLRHGNQVLTVFPERELVTSRHVKDNRALHATLPDNIDQLALFYTLNRLSDDRIANHQALVVDLLPKDIYRYGYRYWIDKDTGMLLRCDLLTEDNSVVEQMMFTSLQYLDEAPQPSITLAELSHFRQQLLDEVTTDVTNQVSQQWVINRLPSGFMLTQSTMRHSVPSSQLHGDPSGSSISGIKPDLLHMVYSDGLASVSVFIEKNMGEEHHLHGASSMGAVNAYGNAIGNHFVTVVGEVPVITVQVMAQSTEYTARQ